MRALRLTGCTEGAALSEGVLRLGVLGLGDERPGGGPAGGLGITAKRLLRLCFGGECGGDAVKSESWLGLGPLLGDFGPKTKPFIAGLKPVNFMPCPGGVRLSILAT